MIKEIKYNGFSETPSDYECPDGDLAIVQNLVPEDGALHPVQAPVVQFTLPDNTYSVIYVHKNTGYKHYIVKHKDEERTFMGHLGEVTVHYDVYYWIDEPEKGTVLEPSDFDGAHQIKVFPPEADADAIEIYEMNSVGNTLMMLTQKGIYYYLWKGEDSQYADLGNHLPEVGITFGLQGETVIGDDFSFDTVHDGNVRDIEMRDNGFFEYDYFWQGLRAKGSARLYYNEDIDRCTNAVLGGANKYIEEKIKKKGKFIFPFLVRYAYRMYDQKLVMHSVPVLMVTDTFRSTLRCKLREIFDNNGGDRQIDFRCAMHAIAFKLDYCAEMGSALSQWSDIIKSVDIFVSAPIYTYKQDGEKVYSIINQLSADHYSISRITASGASTETGYHHIANNTDYSKWTDINKVSANMKVNGNGGDDVDTYSEFVIPYRTNDEIFQDIKDCHDFYLIKSIEVGELATTGRTVIDIPEGYLNSLTVRERMTDDYDSHQTLIPRVSYSYNSRLHIANMRKQMLNPFPAEAVLSRNQVAWAYESNNWVSGGSAIYEIYVFLKKDNRNIVVYDQQGSFLGTMSSDFPFLYYFYPDPDAYKIVVKRVKEGETTKYYEVPLKPHDFLHGAVFFDGWSPTFTEAAEAPTPSSNTIVELPNKMYTSEVGNPFLFLAAGVSTIGISNIVGIRPAVKSVSPLEYGKLPFYVFTKDGLYAMEVSSTGYLQSPHIIAPDIVIGNGESITQVDGAVLFATERGIMLTSGDQVICISDILNSERPFTPFATTRGSYDKLPHIRNISPSEVTLTINAMVPFRTFLQNCRMLYDYYHQRVIAWNPDITYAYVYSLKSKEWGIIPSAIVSTLNNYPAAFTMVSEVVEETEIYKVVDYADEHPLTEEVVVSGMLITRPLKLDMPDVLKTVESVIQRGQFHKGHVKSVLYASRDLYNWHLVWSSVDHYLRGFRGTGYKYFRVALIYDLNRDESITGCTIQFTPRQTDQLR